MTIIANRKAYLALLMTLPLTQLMTLPLTQLVTQRLYIIKKKE